VLPAKGQAQQENGPSGVRVTAQIVTGTVIAPVAFVAGGLAARNIAQRAGASERTAERVAYVGAWALAGLGTSVVPPLLLRGGNYPASLAGTAAGGAAAAVAVWMGRQLFHGRAHCGVICTTFGIATFALPAAGATVVYNRSR
jgi:hypothetical protein